MKNCIQDNLIIVAESGKCGRKDKPANHCCQQDSDDYLKLRMGVMKSEQDNLITAIVAENPAGAEPQSRAGKGSAMVSDKKQGDF